jgi:hypothetical protein
MLASWTRDAVMVADSATDLDGAAGHVVACGSHAGRYAAVLATRAGVRGIALNDAGGGLRDAGVAGLEVLDEAGIPAFAVGHASARIGDGADTRDRGVITRVNRLAAALGVRSGGPAREGLRRLEAGEPARPRAVPDAGEARHLLREGPPAVWALDSASLVRAQDAGAILMIGSHGGLVGGDPARALRADALAAVFNDAGGGREGAGFARLAALDARGIAAGTVAASSAAIGDGRSTYFDGVLSAVNRTADRLGATAGMSARRFADRVVEHRGGPGGGGR